ncbi:hypothetical protein [Nocardioides mesophilus]|uniref:SH3 domain-containing protein n=1 Tax=Nocardioides mesophilus TaxID=433659 RepID=A0A7G9RDI0_9ACTN|nr:hypothetical protein [Nocardioides mesophilus]QNN53655.1 hypothetical protein H9L09_04325 [Nocardioides mesophilus]
MLAILALGAGIALTPQTAQARQARVHDRSGDSSSAATDITQVRVRHARHRISATVTIPRLKPGRLSGTELLIRPQGRKNVYAVTVLRDRRGRVVKTSLSWRPLNDPIEPTSLPCKGIGATLGAGHTEVSVAKACLTKSRPRQPIQAKVRVVDGTIGLQGAYFDDQTRFTPLLARGAARYGAAPAGQVTVNSGLVVRRLPTTFSARQGVLPRGTVFPVTCKLTGSVVRRGGDQNGDVNNLWYRLSSDRRQWVSALYVRNVNGIPPYCGTGENYRGRVTARMLAPREAPTTRANAHGGLARGTRVTIKCKLRAQRVAGNNLWYNLPQGLWVSARYVANIGPAPAYCTR